MRAIRDIKVLDNLYSEEYQDYVKNHLYNTTSWRYRPSLVDTEIPGDWADVTGFANVFKNDDGIINGEGFNTVYPIAAIACKELGYKITNVLYARSFIIQPFIGKSGITSPHVDIDDWDHVVCLYYVDDADGETVFFNQISGETENWEKSKIVRKVEPKKGRVVVFDGRQYHASTLPQENVRTIINFNVEVYKQ